MEKEKQNLKRPNRLEFRNVSGAGLQIHADIPFHPNCVEFVMDKGYQQIMYGAEHETNKLISCEPWIQFKDKDWAAMLENVFQEMVALWNEKYAKIASDKIQKTKKYLFVAEHFASYTGGSLVWVSTEDNIEKVIGKKSLPITDEENVNRFKFEKLTIKEAEKSVDSAVSQDIFETEIKKHFSGGFLKRILAQLDNTGHEYPGYDHDNIKRVRKDWFNNLEPEEGLYIVLKQPVEDSEEERVISDTYYCS